MLKRCYKQYDVCMGFMFVCCDHSNAKKKKKTSNNIFNSMIVLHTIHIYSYILQEAIENSNEMKSNQNVDSLDKQQAK